MNGTFDRGTTDTREDEGGLDPREAARLLAQTQRQAQRGLDFRSPWLSLLAAGVVLVGFGAVWLSVRGQHPYTGPTAASLVVLYALVLIRIGSVVFAHAAPAPVSRGARYACGAPRVPPWRWRWSLCTCSSQHWCTMERVTRSSTGCMASEQR